MNILLTVASIRYALQLIFKVEFPENSDFFPMLQQASKGIQYPFLDYINRSDSFA